MPGGIMSILAGITTGPSKTGFRMLIAAQEKMGKTTLACGAPGVLLVPLEVGFAAMTCAKTPMIQTWQDVIQLTDEITTLAQRGQFPHKTLVFDSATALERQLHDYVLSLDPAFKPQATKTLTMESSHGGYGKAYALANVIFDSFLKKLDLLSVHAGINIIFTCHVFSSKVVDPTSGEYDSWDLLLHSPKNQKTYGKREMITQWADVVAFLYEPIFVVAATDKGGMARGMSQNKGRVLGLSRTPAYLAGNRYGLMGEIPMPTPPQNGWNYFADALFKTIGVDVYTR
jgi:hypothetical protein